MTSRKHKKSCHYSQIERTGIAALVLAALGSHWLWGAMPGISLALFLGALGIAANAVSPRLTGARAGVSLTVLVVAVLPLIEATTFLSVFVALMLTLISALIAAGRLPRTPLRAMAAIGSMFGGMFWRLPHDGTRWRRATQRAKKRGEEKRAPRFSWRLWLMPLALSALFGSLFAAANPVIEGWLNAITLPRYDFSEAFLRGLFFALLMMVSWSVLRPKAQHVRAQKVQQVFAPSIFFGSDAILRALILFNALFALQTFLDLALLWGGGALPEGLTYAGYAHRGAYPLVATALLAALFVLVALRPGSDAAASPLIRWLVYLWVGQNALLVISSILRLDLYVGIYGLTPLRIAAFVWMGLIVSGLCLIVARIALEKSGEWLVGRNLAVLTVTLYGFCFVDVTALMGRINLEVGAANGRGVDLVTLSEQGGYAIPYIDIKRDQLAEKGISVPWLENWRRDWEVVHREAMKDWRSWTRRDAALLAYLDANPYRAHKIPRHSFPMDATE